MISFPLSIILIPYAIFIIIIALFAYINLRNLVRFRAEDIISFGALFVFLAGLAFLSYFSFNYLVGVDWKQTIELGLNFKKGF